MDFDAIVVGSGPAGVFAAHGLKGRRVLMLDVGRTASGRALPQKNIFDLRRESDLFPDLIGQSYEGLHNIDRPYLSPKLKAPLMRFISDTPDGAPGFETERFEAVISYARGGLANAWGAGVFRFNEREMRGFPITASELSPYYDEITEMIGVSGATDDLAEHFGPADAIQPPLPLSALSRTMLQRYQRSRRSFHRRGIRVGRTRAAILTREHDGRAAHAVLNQEFFQPNIPAIYHPGYTLDRMIDRGDVTYLGGRLVTRFEEREGEVRVLADDLATGRHEQFSAARLFIAAGALNSARLVLQSHDDHASRVPVLDNPVSYLPLACLSRIGCALDTHGFSGAELIVLYDGELSSEPLQATFYGLVAPLRADLFFEYPLSLRGNLAAMKYLTPAVAMLQFFFPDDPNPESYAMLGPGGELKIRYRPHAGGPAIGNVASAFRRIGFIGHPLLSKHLTGGSSMHYAGTLPMREHPETKYETDSRGLLFGSRRVHVVDAALFPRLPSKNLTFTIMANALRIGRAAAAELTP